VDDKYVLYLIYYIVFAMCKCKRKTLFCAFKFDLLKHDSYVNVLFLFCYILVFGYL